MTNKISFIIQINDTHKIKCCYIDSNKKETPIQLHNKTQQQEYLLSKSIEFAEDLFPNPQEFKFYNIELYGKEYTVIAEVLFALLIDEFKEQIEKEFIIDKTIVELTVNNLKVNSRIITALTAIGLENIQLEDDDEEEINFDYQAQGEILHEILAKKQEYNKRKRMI